MGSVAVTCSCCAGREASASDPEAGQARDPEAAPPERHVPLVPARWRSEAFFAAERRVQRLGLLQRILHSWWVQAWHAGRFAWIWWRDGEASSTLFIRRLVRQYREAEAVAAIADA